MLIVQSTSLHFKNFFKQKSSPIFIWLLPLWFLNAQHCIPYFRTFLSKDPGAAPDFVKAFAESSTAIRVVWKPPPVGKRNGDITYYKIFYVPSSVPSTREEEEATLVRIEDSDAAEFVIDELKKWTEYRVWMLAGTIVGDGPPSYPVLVRTGEDGRFALLL